MNTFDVILPFLKPIEHLILDDSISEVMVNGQRQVFVERDGVLQEVPHDWPGEGSLLVAVKNIARCLGDEISESRPILDSRLLDGSRVAARSEEHTSELQSHLNLVCRLLLEKKKNSIRDN